MLDRRPAARLCPLLLLLGLAFLPVRAATAQAANTSRLEGAALIAELGCGACHTGVPAARRARQAAPPFTDAGLRYDPAYLYVYLQNPVRVRAGLGRARMPDFRFDERESLALALYLASLRPVAAGGRRARGAPAARGTGERAAWQRAYQSARRRYSDITAQHGRTIFLAQNCAGCHAAPAAVWASGPPLANAGARLRADWLRAFLRAPHAVRPFGFFPGTGSRMPDFRLSAAEADAIATFLLAGAEQRVDAPAAASAPLSRFARAQAERQLREKLSCLGCHALDGAGGRIAPDLARVAARLQPQHVRAMLSDPQRAMPGSIMPRPVLPQAQLERITGYLLEPRAATTAAPRYLSLIDHTVRFPAPGEDAARVYARVCALCHGARGQGNGYNARFLSVRPTEHADGETMARRPDDTLFDGIYAGGYILNRSHLMPAFGETLTREQISALVTYLRELCACEGPAWSRSK